MIDNIDKSIIKIIQENIPITTTPFKDIANILNISEDEVIKRIERMKENGIIRRFGAVLKHQKAGITANGMIVWNIPDDKVEEIGKKFAGFKEVSHCYERPRIDKWPYNVFTMVHGKNREECIQIAKKLSEISGIKDYNILFSEKEFKKSSMKYFIEE
jgi:DNA-binding Lrp family transcriptional regulator